MIVCWGWSETDLLLKDVIGGNGLVQSSAVFFKPSVDESQVGFL